MPDILAPAFGLPAEAARADFFMVEDSGVGKEHPFSGEKLSLVLTVYRVKDFAAAKEQVRAVLDYQGNGHSCGIHTKDMAHARELAEDLDVVRVLVNFAHTFGNGGGFDSGLGFTLTMGCGSWQKNSISENLSYKHFLNITHLVTVIPEDKPSEDGAVRPALEQIRALNARAVMNFEEHVAKAKVLVPASIAVPRGKLCVTPDEAEAAFGEIGPCVVKAQVPTGKRGKAGGIRKADSAAEAGGRGAGDPRHGRSTAIASKKSWSRNAPRSRANSTPRC